MSRRIGSLEWLPFALCSAGFLIAFGTANAGTIKLVKDSSTYLEFAPIRTGGYPAFLELCQFFGLSLPQIGLLQALLYAASAVWLAFEVSRLTRLKYLGLSTVILLWALPPLTAFHFQISTESVFLSLEVVFLALLLRIFRLKDAWAFLTLCVTAGVAAVVRPVGMAFLPLVPIMLIWCFRFRGPKRLAVLALAGGLVVVSVFAIERGYYRSVHGTHHASLAGLHMFAKAALLRTSASTGAYADIDLPLWQSELLDRLGAETEPVRKLIWSIEDLSVRDHFVNAYEAYYQYSFHKPVTKRAFRDGRCGDQWCSDVLLKLGMTRVREAPGDYLRLTVLHYLGLWTVYGVRTQAGAERLLEFNRANTPLPLEAGIEKFTREAGPLWYAAPVKAGVQLMGVLSAVAVAWMLLAFLARKPVHPYVALAGLCGMLVHGNLLGVALSGVSISRYTVAMWPTLLICMIFLGLFFVRVASGRIARTPTGQTPDGASAETAA